MGRIIMHEPRIRPILHIVDPIALPTAKSALAVAAEYIETVNSGIVVAKLTIVAPITT